MQCQCNKELDLVNVYDNAQNGGVYRRRSNNER